MNKEESDTEEALRVKEETIAIRLETIRRLMDTIRASGIPLKLGRPLKERELKRFEDFHQIRMPEDFRSFVTTLGNGGSGPGRWIRFNPRHPFYQRRDWARPWQNTNFLSDHELDERDGLGIIELFDYGCGIFDFLVCTGPEAGTMWFSDSICNVSPELSPEQKVELFGKTPDLHSSESAAREILHKAEFPFRSSFLDHYERWLRSLAPDSDR